MRIPATPALPLAVMSRVAPLAMLIWLVASAVSTPVRRLPASMRVPPVWVALAASVRLPAPVFTSVPT
ncbi:hypothetical protein D3C71_1733010 [compost metagenome]